MLVPGQAFVSFSQSEGCSWGQNIIRDNTGDLGSLGTLSHVHALT